MPGDMSRGIELHPVVVTVTEAPCGTSQGGPFKYSVLSEAHLITLPIPDASMPFNVLTLVLQNIRFLCT
jgi:hypothetical protein